MAATYDDATYIHGSSRLTYNGEADNTVGTGTPPKVVARVVKPRIVASPPRPR